MASYESRRRAEAMNADIPVITEDVEAATVYEQSWAHRDGMTVRAFAVLALDPQMAEQMGGIRIAERFGEPIMNWKLVSSLRYSAPPRCLVIACLSTEDPDETQLREETFRARRAA